MKSADDVINDQFERKEQYDADKKRKRAARMKVIIPVCAVCCAVLLGVGVWKSGVLRKIKGTNGAGNGTEQTTVTPGGSDNSQPTPTVTTPTDTPTVTPTATPMATPTIAPPELEGATNLTEGSSGTPAKTKEMDNAMRKAYGTFAYKLFAELPEGKTRMISPFSVYVALSMLANGAEGETLAQIDELLGLTAEERNAYLAAWIKDLKEVENGATTFTNADSIWIYDEFKSVVPKDFLAICAQYYRAAVLSAPMDDSTVRDINAWVKNKTRDMIDTIIDELPDNTAMVLMNAIALDAAWEGEFDEAETQKDYTFTKADGTSVKVDMMFGEFSETYLHNELCTGFVKSYKGNEFSYVALLPREGVSLEQLIASLTPKAVQELFDYCDRGAIINLGMPKYEADYSIEFSDVLKGLGMTDAFDDSKADFSRLIEQLKVYVTRVIHKTHISVDEKGTKAEAVTYVETGWKSMPMTYWITLDRPFVYMIVDSNGLPIFIGTYEG
ncbi:MAG: serpin family protein [Lachnospiraceae bacterium]|nr:serpin family protein [Lachnospiraceae bacterium]